MQTCQQASEVDSSSVQNQFNERLIETPVADPPNPLPTAMISKSILELEEVPPLLPIRLVNVFEE